MASSLCVTALCATTLCYRPSVPVGHKDAEQCAAEAEQCDQQHLLAAQPLVGRLHPPAQPAAHSAQLIGQQLPVGQLPGSRRFHRRRRHGGFENCRRGAGGRCWPPLHRHVAGAALDAVCSQHGGKSRRIFLVVNNMVPAQLKSQAEQQILT